MKVLLNVEKSTPSKKGGFVNTLRGEIKTTVFGVAKTTKVRFLLKTDAEVAADTEQELDLAEYTQQVTEFEAPDGNIIKSTWLHLKVA